MKNLRLTEQKGIAQIFLLVGMLLVAISMPLATKLVQQNQENRSNAAVQTCTSSRNGYYSCDGKTLRKCSNSGGWGNYHVATCKTEASCYASGKTGYCKEVYVCVNGWSEFWAKSNTNQQKTTSTQCLSLGCNTATGKCNETNPNTKANGECGSAHLVSTDTKPTSGLCKTNYGGADVTKSSSDTTKSWIWSCWGTGGGSAVPCWTKTPSTKCTSYTYSAWSTCTNGKQTRTVTGKTPSDCSESAAGSATKVTSQDCTTLPTCSSKGGVCIGNVRTCTDVEGGTVVSGTNCSGTTPVCCKEKETPTKCTSYTYSAWSTCTNGKQTRTVTGKTPSNCSEGAAGSATKVTSQDCTTKVSCTSKGGACIGGVKTCTEAEGGTVISGTDCSGNTPVCCAVSSCTSGGKKIVNGGHVCQKAGDHSVEYVCTNGSLKVYEACVEVNGVSVGCTSDGTTCSANKSKNGSCNSTYNGGSFTYDKFPVSSPSLLCSTGSPMLTDGVANDGKWNWECRNIGANGVAIANTGVKCSATKVASATKNECEKSGGQCMTSSGGMTSGITCSLNGVANSGKTILTGGCTTGNVCCLPASVKQDGVCVTYSSNTAYPRIDSTCVSGVVEWIDSKATDGQFEWKCNGISGGSPSGTCTAKSKVDGSGIGSPSTNSSACKAKGGVCAAYSTVLKAGASCQVTGYKKVGSVVTGLCSGDSKTVCCTGITTPVNPNPPVDPVTPTVDPVTPPVTTVPSTNIILNPTTVTLMVGETKAIVATLEPSNSTDTVAWTSNNSAIAAVSTGGVITGASSGTAVITATTTSGKTATVNVTINPAAAGSAQISFKFAFFGIQPGAACISSLENLNIEVANVPTGVHESGLSAVFAKLDDDQVDTNGNQIFQVTALSLDATKFGSVNNANYIKIKGPFHLRRRMCADGQTSKVPETTTCDIDLTRTDGYIYDFSKYTLLSGDINKDGIVNGADFGLVKSSLDSDDSVSCGRQGDLNMDGVINGVDAQIIKITLLERDDE